jgi:hypothetical protein
MLERRKNGRGFPVPSRIINGLLRVGGTWQQFGAAPIKKAGVEPAFPVTKPAGCDDQYDDQYLATIGPPK